MKKIKLTYGRNFLGYDSDYTNYENLVKNYDLHLFNEKVISFDLSKLDNGIIFVESKNYKTSLSLSQCYVYCSPIQLKSIENKVGATDATFTIKNKQDLITCVEFIKGTHGLVADTKKVVKQLGEKALYIKKLISKHETHIFNLYNNQTLTYNVRF